MEENFFKGKWKEAKGEIQTTWGKLTGDELEQTKGNLQSIGGLIQQKYGHAKEEVSQKLSELTSRFTGEAADKTEDAKEDLRTSETLRKEERLQ
ncbi:MAG: CsbD family protein [Proteobacteria bacterium]|nr:MAG: CsbD family protein [Pseudomonadota bacterium]